MKTSIPTIAAKAKDMLYNTAMRRLKLSHKYPNTILLIKKPEPITTLYIPYAVPRSSDETYFGIIAL
jgi:hypothetical protein